MTVGPLTILRWDWADPDTAADVAPHLPDGTRFFPARVAVERGRRVTISLPPGERGVVGLVYGADRKERVGIDESQHTVTFIGCDPKFDGTDHQEDFFTGGFLLRDPRCVPLRVEYDDRTEEIALPFGAGQCPPQ